MDLLWLQLAVTWGLVGLIWTIQVVHYPLLAAVGSGFAAYHRRHCDRIAWLVGPLMGLEALTVLVLWADPPAGVSQAEAALGAVLALVIWGATIGLSVPEHSRLAGGWDEDAWRRLVSTNWVRTLAWSGRGLLALHMVRAATVA